MSGSKKTKALVMVLMFTMFISILASSFVYAGTPASETISDANFTITREVSKINALLNSEVKVTYTVTPAEIEVEVATPTKKEFILLIDTSKSMINNKIGSKTRLAVAVEAANNFLTDMEALNIAYPGTVKAGLITFDNLANVKTYGGKVLTTDFSSTSGIKKTLSGITPNNGTNLGDGLRRAYYELSKVVSDAEKYVILLSDGDPTCWSLKGSKLSSGFYTADGNPTAIKKSWEESSSEAYKPEDYFEEIAKMMGNYNKNNPTKKIEPFMIAYSSGANKTLLEEMNVKAGGSKSNVYSANSSQELIDVFTSIGDVIAKDYSIKDIVFKQTLPLGLSLPDGLQEFAYNIDKIDYRLNDAKNKYIADPFTFSFTIKCNKAGTYILSNDVSPSFITYKDISGGSVNTSLSTYVISVSAIGTPDITVNRTIDPTSTIISSPVTATYTIDPGVIPFPVGIPEGDLPATLTVSNVKITEKLPDGVVPQLPPGADFDPDTNILTIPIDPIVYVKDEDNDRYIPQDPDPVIEVPITPEEEGTFSWDGEIIYNDFYGNTQKNEYGGGPFGSDKYGKPDIWIISVTRRGEVVDVKVGYTIPGFTSSAKISKTSGNSTTDINVTMSGEMEFKDLSIYKKHTAIINSISTTSVPGQSNNLVLYNGIDVN